MYSITILYIVYIILQITIILHSTVKYCTVQTKLGYRASFNESVSTDHCKWLNSYNWSYTVLYCTVMYCNILYCDVLFCNFLYYNILNLYCKKSDFQIHNIGIIFILQIIGQRGVTNKIISIFNMLLYQPIGELYYFNIPLVKY